MSHLTSFTEQLIRFFPPAASNFAGRVDTIFFTLCGITLFFVILIAGFIIYFGVRYRRSVRPGPPPHVKTFIPLEIAWTIVPLCINIVMFTWAGIVYLDEYKRPQDWRDYYEVAVLGKQWMWKFEHPNGRREVNELHLPVNRKVRLLMVSQDVIHSFFVPAFRLKHDVLPMKYVSLWFEATQPGRYHIFCSQYCGTQHSEMVGLVHVLRPEEFQRWLGSHQGMQSPASEGKALLGVLGCRDCHRTDSLAAAPMLEGLYGGKVRLEDGSLVTADEDYLRTSILDPASQVVAHYQPVMPSYRGRVTEEEVMRIVAYLKSVPALPQPAQPNQETREPQ